jgi:hypothetical protein
MCTELAPQHPATDPTTHQPAGGQVSRRTALLASAGLATSTALTVVGVSPAAADRRHNSPRHGRIDLTYTLGEDFRFHPRRGGHPPARYHHPRRRLLHAALGDV